MDNVVNGIYQHKKLKDIIQITKITKQNHTFEYLVLEDPSNYWNENLDGVHYGSLANFKLAYKPLPYYNSTLYKAINGPSYKFSQPNTPSDKSSVVAIVPSANASLTTTASKTPQNSNKPEN